MIATFPSATPDWCNLKVLHRNTLPPRATFFNYKSVESALTYNTEASETLSLNGTWKFHLASSPFEAPVEFQDVDFDTSKWSDIAVPSVWQLQGFSNPQYLNKHYGIPIDPPNVPFEDNQTGSYVRTFTSPEHFSGCQLRLRFEGVDSAFHCWLNGVEVGYSQGARNPSEFDITNVVQGVNTICVRVYQYCDGSYIEDQDQWRVSGIFREVNILAFPRSHIQDFRVVTDFDGDYKDATLSVTLSVAGEPENAHTTLYGPDKKTIIAESLQTLPPFADELVVSIPVTSPQQWSAETPVLYHLVIQYGSQIIASRVGFRKVEIKDGLIKVNGRRVVFRGANRHEHHPQHGRSVPYEFLRQDLLMMKRHNINSIRTCHQPSNRRLYDLADELGLWVMDEADMECHGWEKVHQCAMSKTERLLEVEERRLLAFGRAGKWLSDNPEWEEAYIDRAHQLVSRDKNHACVVIWSLGNEAFEGRNIEAMYKWVKAYDPTRPIHYEGDYSNRYADLRSTMYPPLNKVVEFAENWDGKKPLVLCEFIHAMGNGPGNIKEYIDLFHKYPCLQGGWVWEWANHGLITKNKEGTQFMGYGGDFGEAHHDGHFVIDGIVTSNHRSQSALLEYAKTLEPIQLVSTPSMESIQITNYYDFIDLKHLECSWKVIGDECPNDETVVPLPALPAGQTASMSLSVIASGITPSREERYLEIIFRLKKSTPWADAGHEIAWLQIPIPASLQQVPFGISSTLSVTQESPTMLEINSSHMKWAFDLLRGRLVSWKKDNRNILHTGPSLSFHRAPTDNDITAGAEWAEKEVRRLKTYTKKVTWGIDTSTGAVEIACVQRVAPVSLEWCFNTTTTYTFRDSQVTLHVTGKPSGINTPRLLPRVGLEMALVRDFETATWFGRGPGESYKDKKHSQRFGRWSMPIEDLTPMYEFPQESGNHTETQWVRFEGAGADTPSLRAAFPHRSQGFDFQASHYSVFDVEKAQHPYELMKKRLDQTIVRLDIDHHGLGSESCGPPTLPEYTLWTKSFDFTVVLEIVS